MTKPSSYGLVPANFRYRNPENKHEPLVSVRHWLFDIAVVYLFLTVHSSLHCL